MNQSQLYHKLNHFLTLIPLPQNFWFPNPGSLNRPTVIPSSLLTRYDRLLRSGGGIPSLMDCLSEGERERDRYEVGVSCLHQIVGACHSYKICLSKSLKDFLFE